jgi:hypothetical protein
MPIKNILVPLDGSKLAEMVLPMASLMAELTGARLILFHAIEQNPPGVVHGEHHLTGEAEAEQYLDKIISRYLQVVGGTACPCYAQKDVANHVAHSQELGVDLIVMCARSKRFSEANFWDHCSRCPRHRRSTGFAGFSREGRAGFGMQL